MLRLVLWVITLIALALLVMRLRELRQVPASATMLPSAAAERLDDPSTNPPDLVALVHHRDPLVSARALERLQRESGADRLETADLARAGRLAVAGTDYQRRAALMLLLGSAYEEWFGPTAELIRATPNPITRDLMTHLLVVGGEDHRSALESWRTGEPDTPRGAVAGEVLFWLDRHQVPAPPPAYDDWFPAGSPTTWGPRASAR